MSAIEIPGYKILKTLGVGGQATVYLAIQQGFDRKVALKVMSPALAADPSFGERFIREAKIVAKLSHSRIVTVYDVGESGSFYYLAMEYMAGEELKTRIAKGLKTKQALVIIAKVAQALHFAHKKGYIHRDVKSENVLFDQDGQPVLTDFGIAKASNSSTQMTQTGKLIGTPEYMSPEQCRGRKLDGRSDLYGLGIILYEMMTRKVPFTGDDSVSVCIQHVTKPIPQLPARINHLQWLIDGLLAKKPSERFQTGQELSTVIKKFLTDGTAEKAITSKKTGGKSSRVSPEISGSASNDDEEINHYFNDEENFELSDDFVVGRRIEVQAHNKSRVTPIATVMIAVVAIGTGYVLKEQWMPVVNSFFAEKSSQKNSGADENKNTNRSVNQVVSDTTKSPSKDNNNRKTKKSNISDVVENTEQLIQRADTLAQYSPHELTDIKQALDILITAKSLDSTNLDVIRIKKNIIDIAFQEALVAARSNHFDRAFEWLKLIESADNANSQLIPAKKEIAGLKLKYDSTFSNEQKQKQQLDFLIVEANNAILEKRLSTPKDNNAIDYLKRASLIAPNDSRIEQKIVEIEEVYITLIETAISKKQFSKANKYVRSLKRIPNGNIDLNVIENNIKFARKKYNTEQATLRKIAEEKLQKQQQNKLKAQKLADPLVQMRLQSNLDAAAILSNQGDLVEPIGNNALDKYRAVLDIDASDPTALKGINKIESTILTNIDVALSNQILDSAQKWIDLLSIFNPNHTKLDDYTFQLNELVVSKDFELPSEPISKNSSEQTDLESVNQVSDQTQRLNEKNNISDGIEHSETLIDSEPVINAEVLKESKNAKELKALKSSKEITNSEISADAQQSDEKTSDEQIIDDEDDSDEEEQPN